MDATALDTRPSLDVGVQRLVGLVELCLDGRLDEHSVEDLHGVVERLLCDGTTVLELDCTELAGLDGFGLALLLDVHRRLEERGGSLVLRFPQPAVAHEVGRAGLLDVLSLAS